MEQYKQDFIEFLVGCGVLTFGDFTTKSGRKTPYFVNTGNYKTGSQLGKLGGFYAKAIMDQYGSDFDNLYGPAYKGIPLSVTTGIALANEFDKDVTITYNRKEAKDHGEGGSLIGYKYSGSEKVVIIEDVITAGTSIRETMGLLEEYNKPAVKATIVSVDRMERGTTDLTAIDQAKADYGIEVFSIVNVREVMEYLHNREVNGKVYIDDDIKTRMEAYLAEYGAK